MNERRTLPFRLNCEGYFFDSNGNMLAKDSGKGYIIFPGGGVNESETIEEGMVRETFEETGAVVENVKKVGTLKIKWSPQWAKTEKQRMRYEKFQGDEMHFFTGIIKEFKTNGSSEEDFWEGSKLLSLKEVIKQMKTKKKIEGDEKEYRKMQFRLLKEIEKGLYDR